MTKNYYECHITFRSNPKYSCYDPDGWKYSRIDGDPVLGKGVKEYYTTFFKEEENLDFIITKLELAADRVRNQGHEVLRTKVELVMYDNKK